MKNFDALWKKLGSLKTSTEYSRDKLPGNRGVRIIYIPSIVPGRYVHFSWLGESFCIRDYLADREMRQTSEIKALDVWKQHEGQVFIHRMHYDKVDEWKKYIKEVTEQTGVGEKT